MKLLIPMAGLIDKEAEMERLGKQIEKIRKELERCTKKLANPSFVERAPEAVVQQEQKRADDYRASLENLKEQLARISTL
ncbi:MAG: hypothetical protein GXP10_09195, partial [Gammaproteobacteria bacterium]|nr:hypothetical protein [Gammaproteobacteria bacterium]